MTFDTGVSARAPQAVLAPVAVRDRVVTLDVLRGFALLGILAVNAMAFAWPFDMMLAPNSAPYLVDGALSPADARAQWWVDVFFADKMRTLFTLLFGVSIFLVGGERSDRARGALLQRRLLWLGAIGLIHGLVFWFGDILLLYALSGLVMLLLRSWSAKKLLWVGGGVTLAYALIQAGIGIAMTHLPAEISAEMNSNPFGTTAEDVIQTVAAATSGPFGWWLNNAKSWLLSSLFVLPVAPFAAVPLMMIGLGLYKIGFLSGRSPVWVYLGFIALAAANLVMLGQAQAQELARPLAEEVTGGWAEAWSAFAPLVAIGYASVLILLTTRGLGVVTRVFAPVGRMAFTNYLAQTLIMTTLFYLPIGPRGYGEVTPAGLWSIVGAVWLVQLIWSPLWLARFQMGPLEWVWRCLTYGRRMPLRR